MIYLWIFFARRTCFILLTILCFDYPVLQVMGQILLTLITAAFMLHRQIFKERRRCCIEVLNEVILLIVSILMLQALQFDTVENQVTVGYSILAILTVLIISNIAIVVVTLQEQRR